MHLRLFHRFHLRSSQDHKFPGLQDHKVLAQVHQVQWLGQQGLRGQVMGLLLQVHLTGDRDQD